MFKRSSSATRSELKAAKRELDEVGRPGGPAVDSDEHGARNDRVVAAEKAARDSRKG